MAIEEQEKKAQQEDTEVRLEEPKGLPETGEKSSETEQENKAEA